MTDLTVHHKSNVRTIAILPDTHQDTFSKVTLGFWMYLMSDCLIFATLFVTYALFHNSTFGSVTSKDIFDLNTAFTETLFLLISSVTCGFAMLSAVKNNKKNTLMWLAVTFFFGISFIAVELHEFSQLVNEGHSWQTSAFLSSFFTLVGTHGLHVSFGLLWLMVMIIQLWTQGIIIDTFRRLVIFSLFWHFLDVIWIFIFTFVYLIGVI